MPKGYHLGEFELRVLLAMNRRGRRATAKHIQSELENIDPRSLGTIYAAIDRLVVKQYIASPDNVPNNVFLMTDAGINAMNDAMNVLRRLTEPNEGFAQ